MVVGGVRAVAERRPLEVVAEVVGVGEEVEERSKLSVPVKFANVIGIVPLRLRQPIAKLLGMFPDKRLWDRSRYLREAMSPNEGGIVPVKLFADIIKSVKPGKEVAMSSGMLPEIKPDSILRQSELFSGVEELKELLNGPCFQLSDGNAIPQYVLGGSCLPLLPWLLMPFGGSGENRTTVTSSAAAYNSVHGSGMELVGKAFGRVRAEWQLLSRPWKEECIELFPVVVVTCCLLHNFLIKCSEALPDVNLGHSSNHDLPLFEGEEDDSAHGNTGIRNALALYLSRSFHPFGQLNIPDVGWAEASRTNEAKKRGEGQGAPGGWLEGTITGERDRLANFEEEPGTSPTLSRFREPDEEELLDAAV
ncbi:hypothetical protein RJ639_020816 [Escallonia herrerae]|uniref:DDE Tnp4 domain-containing protein n=1 Tax=Escallonia herrerae TaxID=1293975 RepID=A0AA89AGR9_9ASTE|nr:hypothetical protein RJ639_020816 [Escallonia herrerae]